MLTILRFLRGYLLISFSGENAEKIINLCAEYDLQTFDVRKRNGIFTLKISINSFKQLRIIKRKTKIRIKILKKCGLPFYLKRMSLKSANIAGIVFFFGFLYFMSLFVWNINISGNKEINDYEIIKNCKKLGVYAGKLKSNIDTENGPLELIISDKRISWASYNIEGCFLTVNITEVTKNLNEENNVPTNIKAKCDGIIKKISATQGNVTVEVGQVVSKGDILISGIVESFGSSVFTNSKGSILAQTEHIYEEKANYYQIKHVLNSKEKKKTVIDFFGLRIPLFIGKISNIKVLKSQEKSLTLFKKDLPVKLYTIKYKDTKSVKTKYSEKDLIAILNKRINKKIKSENFIDCKLLSGDIKREDDGIILTNTYETIENIAESEEIKSVLN